MGYFSSAVALLALATANGIQQEADTFWHEKKLIGPTMWGFSPDGLTIYAPDGNVLKEHRKKQLCKEFINRRGNVTNDCSFFSAASDGHRFVYAAAFNPFSKVEIFDIDTGDYVGYHETCSTPLDLDYHASRKEMWLRCASKTEDMPGEIDVFSSGAIGVEQSMTYLNATGRPYGRLVTHHSMQGHAYASVYDDNKVYEIDVSSKEITDAYEIPKAYGSYEIVYSVQNEHVYARTRACCTCAADGVGADAECESDKLVTVQTGPYASAIPQNGTCSSRTCEGTSSDPGVFEFDPVSKTFLGFHSIKEGSGFGADPISSPDGSCILLLPNDGGQYVRVLKPNKNGEVSSFATDINVAFEGGSPGKVEVEDVAFIKDDKRNFLVIPSKSSNEVALVDMNDNYRMIKIKVSEASESSGTSKRRVEWALGTDYVWVTGGGADEKYIIEVGENIDTAKVVKTITEVADGNMIFVNNYERLRSEESRNDLREELMAASAKASDSDSDSNPIGIAALIIACFSLVVGVALMVKQMEKNKPKTMLGDVENISVDGSLPSVK